jgi:branched-chain amino acid transport system ATP-binding protein
MPISDTATSRRRSARVLSLENVYAGYDDALTLHGVSLEVRRGEMVAIIGANGAGKSTTLRTICGFLRPKKGRIEFDGHSIAGLTPDRIAASGLVHVPEGRRVFPDLTVEENLRAAAYLVRERGEMDRRLRETVERFPLLRERRRQPAGTLSGGEQQMLAFGRAMMTGPKLLLLDEPSLGLSPLLVAEVMRSVKLFREAGATVLLVEQNANLALRLADRGYVMETGTILMEGSGAELLADEHVRASYLGYSRRTGADAASLT